MSEIESTESVVQNTVRPADTGRSGHTPKTEPSKGQESEDDSVDTEYNESESGEKNDHDEYRGKNIDVFA